MNFHCYSLIVLPIVDPCYYLTILRLNLALLILLRSGIWATNIAIVVVTCSSKELSAFECLDYFFM